MHASIRQRNEWELKSSLALIEPSLRNQYSQLVIDESDHFMIEKLRCQHTLQVGLAIRAVNLCKKVPDKPIRIVDIGDSNGTHINYINEILKKCGLHAESLSVNLDPEAIARIRKRGLNALLCRAEELHSEENIEADLFLSFEVLEHLLDPITFLRTLALKAPCQYLAVTVPMPMKSRLGLHYVKQKLTGKFFAENTHIFELSPRDWDLLFQFSGWEVVESDRYYQYPTNHLLSITKYLWRKIDYDGFYGVILQKNLAISNQYQDW